MKVLITGATGFIGGFLAKHCLQAGCSVLGLGIEKARKRSGPRRPLCPVMYGKRHALLEVITAFQPDQIFHLAAQSYPTISLDQPYKTMDINAGGTINLFECLRTVGIAPMVVVACSSAEYGPVASSDLPVRETHPLRPLHPYGVSKVAQDLLAAQYFANYHLPCIRIRIFNTTGPSKVGDVCSDLTKRAAEVELGIRPPLVPVGNLTSRRAIIDVRDTARALFLSAELCQTGDVYNVGANQIYSVQELVDAIRTSVKVPFEVEQDPKLMRSCDEPVIAGDISKFQLCTGWKPEIDLGSTLQEMLDWWRRRLARVPVSESEFSSSRPLPV